MLHLLVVLLLLRVVALVCAKGRQSAACTGLVHGRVLQAGRAPMPAPKASAAAAAACSCRHGLQAMPVSAVAAACLFDCRAVLSDFRALPDVVLRMPQAYAATDPAVWSVDNQNYCCRGFKLGCPSPIVPPKPADAPARAPKPVAKCQNGIVPATYRCTASNAQALAAVRPASWLCLGSAQGGSTLSLEYLGRDSKPADAPARVAKLAGSCEDSFKPAASCCTASHAQAVAVMRHQQSALAHTQAAGRA